MKSPQTPDPRPQILAESMQKKPHAKVAKAATSAEQSLWPGPITVETAVAANRRKQRERSPRDLIGTALQFEDHPAGESGSSQAVIPSCFTPLPLFASVKLNCCFEAQRANGVRAGEPAGWPGGPLEPSPPSVVPPAQGYIPGAYQQHRGWLE